MNPITPELRQAIERAGDRPVEITDPETNIAYVLVRVEVFGTRLANPILHVLVRSP